ncbi:hypothetical protein P7B02_03480 [Caulobacter segnis]|uniref:hypothetical protein n=1 Tax=Caulobacter segnis TaxID=88688 RepID=UPI00240F6700|nr:hypothetical protein [Caulobacter segnis]MDG2520593.1 hypothetical protein [Caulobacter segnis]
MRFAAVLAVSILAVSALGRIAEAAPARGTPPAPELLALRRGLYVEAGRSCLAPTAGAKTYDGATLRSWRGGQCRSERLWSLQGVQRLRLACLVEHGRWGETGRPYVRVLDPQGFEIVEVRPDAVERPLQP